MNIKKLRNRKIFILAFLVICTGILATVLPSLARIQNRTPLETLTVWDGSVASSYRKGSGTASDPYIIASGKELSYFSKMLKNTSYEGKYFALSNDIILNNGVFSYDEQAKYTLNTSTFYLNDKGDFYDNSEFSGVKIGSINTIESLSNFKGHFDGNSYTIYGLYTSSTTEESGLFTNLEGEVKNLYVSNALIQGGVYTGGIASTAKNAQLKNVVFSGHVIGNQEIKKNTETLTLDNISTGIDEHSVNLNIPERQVLGTITSATLKGECTTNFKVDGKEIECKDYQFEATLNNNFKNTLLIETEEHLALNNLTLSLNYDINYTGGLIGVANNVTLENVINKAKVQSSLTAGGLIATSTNHIEIKNSYNTGSVTSPDNFSGLIGTIENLKEPSSIAFSYNNVDNTGFIGGIYNSDNFLTIENSFEAGKYYAFIKKIENSKVTFNNVYSIGTNIFQPEDVEGTVTNISIESLKDKEFMTNTLHFNEFTDNDNTNFNAWIYEVGYLPTLFIDDLQDPIATLNVGKYTWNNLGFDSNKINFASSVAFSINEISNVRPIKESYYYLSKSDASLSKEELNSIDWVPYNEIITLEEEGIYRIYAKVLDNNDNISYINSDIIIIDKSGSEVSLTSTSKEWNTLNQEINYSYIDSPVTFSITATDDLSGIKSIEYYLSNNEIALENLNDITWTNYDTSITIDSFGTKIIYVKVTDNSENITYVNSDYIVYAGYTLGKMTVGTNHENISDITSNSKVTYNFTYNDTNKLDENTTHHLVTNIPLPINTKLTLKDNMSQKVYTYKVTDSVSDIAFTEFKEIGKGNMDVFFQEEYRDTIEENYYIILDFKDTNMLNGINGLQVFIELHDKNNQTSRSTVKNTLKSINIHTDSNALPSITGNYTGEGIVYNSDSLETIDLTASINYQNRDGNLIYDSTYDNKKLGIQIKLVDGTNKTIEKKYLKNIRFKLNGNYYSPEADGITRIKVGDTKESITSNLIILTSRDTITLEEGTYYFKISSLAAYDGLYSNDLSEDEITIPVIVNNSNTEINNYNFDIKADKDYKVLFKNNSNANINFEIIEQSTYTNPNVRITLYQKDKLTAYDQVYKPLDLNEYTNNNLEKAIDNVYYASKLVTPGSNKFNIDLDLTKFKPGGYKFTFELYDGNKRIGSLENKFIVR